MKDDNKYLAALYELKKRLENIRKSEDGGDINFFNAVGMTTQEIKHSSFFAWLLNSAESHKLDSLVVEKLCDKLYDYSFRDATNYQIKTNKGIINNLTKITNKSDFLALISGFDSKAYTEVVTEDDKRIDILVDIPATQMVIVIENKMFTKSHDNQLVNYQNYINSHISGFREYRNKIYIYLSPDGDIPINFGGDECYNDAWCIFDYRKIIDIVDEILLEFSDSRQHAQMNRKMKTKLISILEDYKAMIKTNILMENPNVLEECKKILDDKQLRAAFNLLTLYNKTATEDKVLSFVRNYLGAVEDGSKTQRYFYTQAMKEFFDHEGEKINNRLCRCVCQPSGGMGGIVGFEICISLEKQNGAWTKAQEKILGRVLSDKSFESKTFSGPPNTRVVLLSESERGRMFEEIKPNLEKQLLKFKVILNGFEQQLKELSQ